MSGRAIFTYCFMEKQYVMVINQHLRIIEIILQWNTRGKLHTFIIFSFPPDDRLSI